MNQNSLPEGECFLVKAKVDNWIARCLKGIYSRVTCWSAYYSAVNRGAPEFCIKSLLHVRVLTSVLGNLCLMFGDGIKSIRAANNVTIRGHLVMSTCGWYNRIYR